MLSNETLIQNKLEIDYASELIDCRTSSLGSILSRGGYLGNFKIDLIGEYYSISISPFQLQEGQISQMNAYRLTIIRNAELNENNEKTKGLCKQSIIEVVEIEKSYDYLLRYYRGWDSNPRRDSFRISPEAVQDIPLAFLLTEHDIARLLVQPYFITDCKIIRAGTGELIGGTYNANIETEPRCSKMGLPACWEAFERDSNLVLSHLK